MASTADKPESRPVNKTAHAFREPSNLVCLLGVTAVSVVLRNPYPFVGLAALECVYLAAVPNSRWFDSRLAARYDREAALHREALKAKLFPQLNSDLQLRFGRLEALRAGIAKESVQGKRWYREVVRKMDHLMEKFLLFGTKKTEFVNYLMSLRQEKGALPSSTFTRSRTGGVAQAESASDDWVRTTVTSIHECYAKEIGEIEKSTQLEQNLHNKAVLEKRHEVMDRRQQYVSEIGEILLNIGHQIRLIEDTFGLINDEIRARSPDQVLADIDDAISQTDQLAETLQEVEPFESIAV